MCLQYTFNARKCSPFRSSTWDYLSFIHVQELQHSLLEEGGDGRGMPGASGPHLDSATGVNVLPARVVEIALSK